MAAFASERVLDVRHWTDAYFSFTTTRDDGLRFENGQFVMIGLMVEAAPAAARLFHRQRQLGRSSCEFFSIKVPNGPLTSRLQHIQPGDTLLVGQQAHRHAADQRPASGPQPVPVRAPAPASRRSSRWSRTRKPTSASSA